MLIVKFLLQFIYVFLSVSIHFNLNWISILIFKLLIWLSEMKIRWTTYCSEDWRLFYKVNFKYFSSFCNFLWSLLMQFKLCYSVSKCSFSLYCYWAFSFLFIFPCFVYLTLWLIGIESLCMFHRGGRIFIPIWATLVGGHDNKWVICSFFLSVWPMKIDYQFFSLVNCNLYYYLTQI